MIVVLGGARSGKSSYAERLALRHEGPVAYVATSPHIPGDDDLDGRIARHRADRPPTWSTIEEELDLAAAIATPAGDAFVIVDCLTTWIGNLVHHGRTEPDIIEASEAALGVAAERTAPIVVVGNEVGMGIVPANEMARTYRDLLGRVNQRWVTAADRALLLVAGKAIALHDPDDLLR